MTRAPTDRGDGPSGVVHRVAGFVSRPYVHAPLVAAGLLTVSAAFGFESYRAFVVLTLVVYSISAIGLDFPVGLSGVLSLGHGAAFAVGMFAAGILSGRHGLPFWVALPVAAAFGLIAGLVMAAPAARLGGLGLAIVSLGFTLVLADLVREFDSFTGGETGISNITAIVAMNSDRHLGNLGLSVLAVVVLLIVYLVHWYVRSTAFGRAAIAAKNDPVGARAGGMSPYLTQLGMFAIGSAIGAVAGAINVYVIAYVNAGAINVDLSFLFLAMVVLGGPGSRFGAVIGAAILGGLPIWLARYPNANVIIYAIVLLLIVRLRPRGLIGQTTVRVRPAASGAEPALPPTAEPAGVASDGVPILRARGIGKTFGGLTALRDVDIDVPLHTVVAIVGPNGAGKTTLVNILSGHYPPSTGTVEIDGAPLRHGRHNQVAREVAGRTFQTPRVFVDLAPAEHLRLATAFAVTGHTAPERAQFESIASTLCTQLGLPMRRPKRSEDLGHGQRRFLELAFAISRAPHVLLLDEPATGLSASEIDLLAITMRQLVQLDSAVVLVEHHLELVAAAADRVVVLDLGAVLWEGPPADLSSSAAVREAYLGVSA